MDTPSYFRRSEIMKILQALKEGKIGDITPVFDYQLGFTYPEIDKITKDPKLTKEALQVLVEHHILKREFYDAIVTCPSCNSHKLSLRLKCPSCGSTNLDKGITIEHLHCGHVDLQKKFLKEGRLLCPKCSKELTTLGVDYRKPGIYYKCNNCGEMSTTPKHNYRCEECGKKFEENEFNITKVYKYILDPKSKTLLETWTIDYELLRKEIKKHGWSIEYPATLTGVSGVSHNFSLVIWSQKERPVAEFVVDIEIQEEEVDELKVLSFFAKTFDIRAKKKVLVAVPKLSENAKTIASGYNLIIKECPNAKKVVDAILEVIHDEKASKKQEKLVTSSIEVNS